MGVGRIIRQLRDLLAELARKSPQIGRALMLHIEYPRLIQGIPIHIGNLSRSAPSPVVTGGDALPDEVSVATNEMSMPGQQLAITP